MKRFYLAGHTNFGNRGNEALARSTLSLLKAQLGDVELLIPSYNPSLDGGQWPDHKEEGVRFVAVPQFPENLRWWSRVNRLAPPLTRNWFPGYRVPRRIARDVESCDGVIGSGGDVITLDYGEAPLLWNIGLLEFFRAQGMPTVVWAASLGPFRRNPGIERFAADLLGRLPSVTVRETITQSYLASLGVERNVELVADPAFALKPIPFDVEAHLPVEGDCGLVGLNFSPLIQKFRTKGEDPSVLVGELAAFVQDIVFRGYSVLLVPHVGPLGDDVEGTNNDHGFLKRVLARCAELGSRVTLLPDKLNAGQLKHAISRCRYFIGARTHSTIAAFSTLVPTVCIAYSVKAKGLNKDLFGDERYVVETPDVSRGNLLKAFERLVDDEKAIAELLGERIPRWRIKAARPAELLGELLKAGTKRTA